MEDVREATKRPWKVHPYMSLRVVDANDITIAGTGTDSTIRDQWEANAALIVRAVNSFDGLKAALIEMVDMYRDMANSGDCGFWDPESTDEVKHARAALAASEPQP